MLSEVQKEKEFQHTIESLLEAKCQFEEEQKSSKSK